MSEPGLSQPPPAPQPASPAEPSRWPPTDPATGRQIYRRTVQLASIVPAAFALLLLVVAPGFYGPLFDSRAAILGLPPIVGLVVLLAGLAAINLVALQLVRSELAVGVLVAVTTTIGLFVVLLAPAVALIAVNLST